MEVWFSQSFVNLSVSVQLILSIGLFNFWLSFSMYICCKSFTERSTIIKTRNAILLLKPSLFTAVTATSKMSPWEFQSQYSSRVAVLQHIWLRARPFLVVVSAGAGDTGSLILQGVNLCCWKVQIKADHKGDKGHLQGDTTDSGWIFISAHSILLLTHDSLHLIWS